MLNIRNQQVASLLCNKERNNHMFYIANKNSILISLDGETLTIDRSFPQYEAVVLASENGDWVKARDLIDTGRAIHEFGGGQIKVSSGIVTFGEYVVDNSLTKRILKMIAEGEVVDTMVNFLTNLMDNPSHRSVEETYGFLQQNNHSLTEDGCFMAYKNVNEDYMDKYTRTFSNKVGDVCEMPRFQVCDDKTLTCSAGLHFCSLEYLKGFWGTEGHTMLIKVNPRDVVSIPVDYNNSKGRCCKYEVVGEVKFKDGKVVEVLDKSVWKAEPPKDNTVKKTTDELLQELIDLQTAKS